MLHVLTNTRLARLGDVYPIGESSGMVTIEGNEWELFIGMNGAMQVYSFVAPSPRYDFSGDAKQFYNHLETEQGFPVDSQNMVGKSAAQSLPSLPPCIANRYSLPIRNGAFHGWTGHHDRVEFLG